MRMGETEDMEHLGHSAQHIIGAQETVTVTISTIQGGQFACLPQGNASETYTLVQ